MTPIKIINNLVAFALLVASFGAIANPATEESIFLECNVSGVDRLPWGQEVLRPALVSVEVYRTPTFQSITVDGPDSYVASAHTGQNPNTISTSNFATDTEYHLRHTRKGVSPIKTSETTIRINRVTSLITVNYSAYFHDGKQLTTNYSGSCKKINNQKKF